MNIFLFRNPRLADFYVRLRRVVSMFLIVAGIAAEQRARHIDAYCAMRIPLFPTAFCSRVLAVERLPVGFDETGAADAAVGFLVGVRFAWKPAAGLNGQKTAPCRCAICMEARNINYMIR